MNTKKIILALLFCMAWLSFYSISLAESNFNVQITTSPSAKNIGPDDDFVHTTLLITDKDNQAIANTYVKMNVYAPRKNLFLSTDFPWVEGTHLMAYEGYLEKGILDFDYIYPIRGKYRFDIEAGPNPTSLSQIKSLGFVVHENPEELRNLMIFIALILGFGIMSGYIIGRGSRTAASMAGVILLFSVLWLGMPNNACADHSHGDHSQGASQRSPLHEEVSSSGMTLEFSMNPGAGKVGEINKLAFMVKNSSGKLIPDTTFEIKFWHIEDDKPVFFSNLFSQSGLENLNFQFFDGAEHEIRIKAMNAQGSILLNHRIEVEAIHPPMRTKILTVIYFVIVIFVGMLFGFRLQNQSGLKNP